jgi:hypothetical protein
MTSEVGTTAKIHAYEMPATDAYLIGAESLRAATFGSHIPLTANFGHERILGNTARNSAYGGRIIRWRYNLCEATSYKGPRASTITAGYHIWL